MTEANDSDEEWSRLENLPAIALQHLGHWSKAAWTQADRATDENSGHSTRISDSFMFAQALRQVIRAAELLADTLEPASGMQEAQNAVQAFRDNVPNAVNIRDVLDHFDDYARGIGKLSRQPGVSAKHHQPSEESARMLEPKVLIDGPKVTISCGTFSIDVRAASEATEVLVAGLFDAIGFVEADENDLIASIGEFSRENPTAVAFLAMSELVSDDFDAESIEVLRALVTPESIPSWGDFREARMGIKGYGIGSVPSIEDDVAYVKFVPETKVGRVATRPILITNAMWATLVYRPDLGGGWYLHGLGPKIRRIDSPDLADSFHRTE